jgi:hypothetical protein
VEGLQAISSSCNGCDPDMSRRDFSYSVSSVDHDQTTSCRSVRGSKHSQHLENWPGRIGPLYGQTTQVAQGFKDPFLRRTTESLPSTHDCDGPHPIPFEIALALGPNRVTYNTHSLAAILSDPSYLAQPATYPLVGTHARRKRRGRPITSTFPGRQSS